jgi:protein phosphatase
MTMKIPLPQPCLVVLIGASGSGKSTFARRHFSPFEILSSDRFRGMVSDDETDQSATFDAFEVLNSVCEKRLRRGLMTVVDATNLKADARRPYLELARKYATPVAAIVLNLPVETCIGRNTDRAERQVPADVVKRHADLIPNVLTRLHEEGFRRVTVLSTPEEIASVAIERDPLPVLRPDLTGPFDLIGDVHGCLDELTDLLIKLGYTVRTVDDVDGRPVIDVTPQPGRSVLFVGDLVDRGPDTPGVLRLAMRMTAAGTALSVRGNHDDKLLRKLLGRDVKLSEGLQASLTQLDAEPPEFADRVREYLAGLQVHYVLDQGRLVVAHAGIKQSDHGRMSDRIKAFCLYGETNGEKDEHGLPVRLDWASQYTGDATIVYGHTPRKTAVWANRTINIDTGCVFGHELTALRYPEREIVAVPARRVYAEPPRPITD